MTFNERQGRGHKVVVLGAVAQDSEAICRIIEKGPYRTETCPSFRELETMLASDPCLTVILDIDSVPLDDRTIRKLTLSYPSTCFLCTSKERFHPDLKDAISHHLFACLHKPIDPEELHYFLKCIRDNETESRGPPDRSD
jgi:DNA-binding NtrC family response regulator